MQRILVAIDGSDHANRALAWAKDLARRQPGAVLHVVSVAPVVIPAIGGGTAVAYERFLEIAQEQAMALLERTRTELIQEGFDVRVYAETGRPSQGILKVAEEIGAELIVVGRRGLSRLEGLLLGSVSSEVLHLAKQPVVVVH